MLGLMNYGKDWKKVEEIVATRSGSQVRSHAQKFFNKLQKKNKVSKG
jgi:SHAQKYF class myb-like DNA-binding protein